MTDEIAVLREKGFEEAARALEAARADAVAAQAPPPATPAPPAAPAQPPTIPTTAPPERVAALGAEHVAGVAPGEIPGQQPTQDDLRKMDAYEIAKLPKEAVDAACAEKGRG